MPDGIEIRFVMVDGAPALEVIIPLRLVRELITSTPGAFARTEPEKVASAALIAEVVALLTKIDPDRRGCRPKHILAALDQRGIRFWPDRPTRVRLGLLTTRLNHERYRPGSPLQRLDRARYTAAM
jgi:hypothetical protein